LRSSTEHTYPLCPTRRLRRRRWRGLRTTRLLQWARAGAGEEPAACARAREGDGVGTLARERARPGAAQRGGRPRGWFGEAPLRARRMAQGDGAGGCWGGTRRRLRETDAGGVRRGLGPVGEGRDK
jgi:hypothetical protein